VIHRFKEVAERDESVVIKFPKGYLRNQLKNGIEGLVNRMYEDWKGLEGNEESEGDDEPNSEDERFINDKEASQQDKGCVLKNGFIVRGVWLSEAF